MQNQQPRILVAAQKGHRKSLPGIGMGNGGLLIDTHASGQAAVLTPNSTGPTGTGAGAKRYKRPPAGAAIANPNGVGNVNVSKPKTPTGYTYPYKSLGGPTRPHAADAAVQRTHVQSARMLQTPPSHRVGRSAAVAKDK